MIHPLVIAIWLADGIAVLLLFAAALRAEPVVREWAPATATRRQLVLERHAEAASLLGRAGSVLLGLSSIALLLAVTVVLPDIVPGAMCGTGVIEAGHAEWSLALRGLALLLWWTWSTIDGLDRTAPRAPLARLSAAGLLGLAPVAAWAGWQTALVLARLDGQSAVDCCAAMYADAAAATAGPSPVDTSASLYLFGLGAIAIVLGALALSRAGSRRATHRASVVALGVLTFAWAMIATEVLIQDLVAYHYEVLAHHCPWCLFLPEHYGVGYLLFGALAVAVLETSAAVGATAAGGIAPALHPAASQRVVQALRRVALSVVVFTLFATGPAMLWGWRFQVWL